MRRKLVPLLGGALIACEDGPPQSYVPYAGPPEMQNGADAGPWVDPVKAPLQECRTDFGAYCFHWGERICADGDTRVKWAKMLTADFVPPRILANIDLAGDDSWRGLTLEEAERINCVAHVLGRDVVGWGDGN